jgi:hypothetical protein
VLSMWVHSCSLIPALVSKFQTVLLNRNTARHSKSWRRSTCIRVRNNQR